MLLDTLMIIVLFLMCSKRGLMYYEGNRIIYKMQKEYSFIKSISLFRKISGEECGQYNLKLSLVDFPCWDAEKQLNIIFEEVSNLTLGNIIMYP